MAAIRIDIQDYEVGSVARGTKASFELTADIGLDEPLILPVLQIEGAKAGPTLLILASVHGDEYEGVETVLRLYRDVLPERIAGRLILIPTANPLAYRGGTRISPEDGANMARAFPGKAEGTPTERIAWHLHHRFIAKADFMLDLHSGGTHYAIPTLVGYYHNDEADIGRRSRAAAEAFGVRLLWAHAEIASGRSVSSALALGVPWVYTEAYGGRRVRRDEAEAFYGGAFRLMRHLGMLLEAAADGQKGSLVYSSDDPSDSDALGKPQRIYGDGNFDGSETAEADGFFIPERPLGSIVNAGEPIGSIRSFDGSELQRVEASRDGMIVMLPGTPVVRQGEPLFLIAPTAE